MAAESRLASENTDLVDRHERAVMQALGDQNYDFRSVVGLSQTLGLEPEIIEAIMQKHSDEIRVAAVPDANGETLYTLRSRPRKIQERLSEAFAFVAGSSR